MNYLQLAAIILAVTGLVGILLAMYLTRVCTRVTDDNEEYDAKIIEGLNKEYKK